MEMKLYCFGESGASYKVALTLTLAGVDWKPVFVDFFNGGARTPEFRTLNPMAEVPVLVDGDMILSQSGAILDYISSRTGQFGGRSAIARREVLRWIFWDNHKLSGVAGNTRFLMNFLPENKRPAEVIAFQKARLHTAYGVLNDALSSADWLVGDAPTIADFSCCGYLFYPEPFGFIRSDWPHIDTWLDRIAALPGWKAPYDLMPGNPSDRA
jgi:glutathione S-transferase